MKQKAVRLLANIINWYCQHLDKKIANITKRKDAIVDWFCENFVSERSKL